MNPQTLIVDVAHLAYRNLSKTGADLYTKGTNLPVKSLHGILSSLNKVLNENPMIRKIYMCFEGHSKFRHDIYPDYKANREHNPESPQYKSYIEKDAHGWSRKDSLSWTIRKVKEISPKFALHVVQNDILEGDDCAYALAKQLYGKEDLIFMSDDRDWEQLVYLFPGCKIYRAMAGEIITQENFYQTQGLPSNWFVYKKAFLGDRSDNIKSVAEGCGEKAIEFLIQKAVERGIDPNSPTMFTEVRQLITDLSDNNELGRYKGLVKFLDESAENNYKLNIKLVDFRQCPMPLLLTETIETNLHMDFDEALEVIQELEFDSLIKIIKPGSPWFRLQ